MTEKRWILLSAPSGLRIDDTIEKLANSINKKVEISRDRSFLKVTKKSNKGKIRTAVAFGSVQNRFLAQPSTREALSKIFAESGRSKTTKFLIKLGMQDAVWSLPWKDLTKLWEEATKKCINDLNSFSEQQDPEITIKVLVLLTHSVLYSGQRKECRARVGVLENISDKIYSFPFSCVITLIDDIYDMFLHLSREKAVFSDSVDEEKKEILDMMQAKKEKRDKIKFADQYSKVAILTNILEWRQAEITAMESFASRKKIKFIVLGVKQSCGTLLDILTGEDPKTVYLSHPISEVRREAKKKGNALQDIEIVREINSIPSKISSQSCHRLVTLAPTAIDEFRFETKTRKAPYHKSNFYSGHLTKRWPFITSENDLLYVPPNGCKSFEEGENRKITGVNYKTKEAQYWKGCSHALIATLVRQIKKQVGSRDRVLVSNADNIIIYRPIYGKTVGYSSGTRAELRQWINQVRMKLSDNSFDYKKNHAVIIHTSKDLESALERIGNGKRKGDAKQKGDSSPFRSGNLSPSIKREEKEMREREQFLGILLPSSEAAGESETKILDIEDLITKHIVGIWIINDEEDFEKILPDLTDFLEDKVKDYSRAEQWWENYFNANFSSKDLTRKH